MVDMGRWLAPHHHHHPALLTPVSKHSRRFNFYIGIVFMVFMFVSVGALFCCCYHLEWRLRVQARSSTRRSSRGTDQGTLVDASVQQMDLRPGKKIKQETNLSVLMPGDNIPRFLAWPNPHGPPDHSDAAEQIPRTLDGTQSSVVVA